MDEDRITALEQRLQRVEDELAITRLIASYGPLVDAGEADAVAAMWAEDGEYDVEGWQMSSRADVHAMVLSEQHQGLIAGGSCHFLGPAAITIDGDTAAAVCESLLVLHHEGRFKVWRAGANHFELGRADDRWVVLRRTTRALDGNQSARDLLARSR
jgi:hypothetical protein